MISETLQRDLARALKKQETVRLSVLRMAQAAIHNQEIAKRTRLSKEGKSFEPLSEEEVVEVLAGEAKKRREAILEFEKAGRADLVANEKAELGILETYLPPQLSREEIQPLIDEALKAVGAENEKDLGKMMGYLAPKLKGKAEMGAVREMILDSLKQ
jgi:uncharacterized protein YqeY